MATKPKKFCPICCADGAALRVSPTTCSGGHDSDQRACFECWEAYLSKEVEEQRPENIKCMFKHTGNSTMDKKRVKDFARKGTFERYKEKVNAATSFCCQNRCWASKRDPNERNSPSVPQQHSREKDGRVFACKFCDFQTCIDCDRPEHQGESCAEYRARVMDLPQHIQNDEATAAKFHRCPSCAAFWDWDDRDTSGKVVSSGKGKAKGKKCGYTRCDACKYRFCGNCLVPWVGEGSAYLLGKTAHAKSCRYYRKLAESKYALHNRLEPDEETKAKLSEKKEKAKAKNAGGETEKKRKGSADDVGTIEETPRSGVAKKQKRVATWWDEVAVRA